MSSPLNRPDRCAASPSARHDQSASAAWPRGSTVRLSPRPGTRSLTEEEERGCIPARMTRSFGVDGSYDNTEQPHERRHRISTDSIIDA